MHILNCETQETCVAFQVLYRSVLKWAKTLPAPSAMLALFPLIHPALFLSLSPPLLVPCFSPNFFTVPSLSVQASHLCPHLLAQTALASYILSPLSKSLYPTSFLSYVLSLQSTTSYSQIPFSCSSFSLLHDYFPGSISGSQYFLSRVI